MEREEFLARLTEAFPEVASRMDQYQKGLLHCEMGVLLDATEDAMDAGRLWEAERHFRFVADLLEVAGPELRNALEVSYLESLALGECLQARYQAVKERMPKKLRQVLISHNERWR